MLLMNTMGFFNPISKKKTIKKQDLNATKFFLACQEGDLDKVKKYMHQKRINIHQAVDEYARTALHLASEYGHIGIVRHLVHVGQMNIETKNDTGATALHFACRRNQLAMIQYLVGCDDDDDDETAATKNKNSKTQRLERSSSSSNSSCHANVRAVDDANHTALHFASYLGYIEIVRFLLSVWPNNIAAIGIEGHTPLHNAAETGHLDIVKYFLEEYDADPNVTTNDGYTPLHFACQKGHLDVVKYLIVSLPCHHPPVDMNVTTTDEYHYTPYDLAVKMNKADVIEFMDLRRDLIHIYFGSIENGNYSSFLKCVTGSDTKNGGSSTRKIHHKSGHLNYGIDVATTKQDNGNMALHVAAMHYRSSSTKHNSSSSSSSSSDTKNGYIEIIHYIIHELQININTMNDDGWNALHLACAKGHADLVRYFGDVWHVDYQHGSSGPIIITNDANGDTLLHLASRYGHLDIVQYFVAVCHVDIGITNKQDQTPHEVACITSQDNIIEYYVQRQEIEDQFFEAAQQGDLDRMKECMNQDEYGIDVKSLNVNQSTVLHFACRYGHLHVVQYLTQHYDDSIIKINARNKDGCTPLHYASGYGHLPIVKYLIDEEGCHSYINDMTNDGDTAYDLALSFQSYNVANYLSRITQHPNMIAHKEPVTRSLLSPQQPSRPSFRTTTMLGTADNKDGGTTLDPEVLADRTRLESVMKDPTADPIIIGLKYLDFCTNQFTSKLLGEGAFGKVYLGYDHDLNNVQLAIKRIRFDALDETKINQIALSFRREISVLKRFRHPNIVIMYGYNVQLQQSSQFLVYEYLSNGSLNTFLMDEKGRTRLPSQIRLSIMFQITRSIHFLHTGGCDDLVIYHRDIKSGNICLTKDYTAKLIDCGLAKFVPDNRSAMAPGSVSPTILNDSGAVAFGTPGYVCPIYSRGHVTFSAACDVFSLGVVFAELIVGCLQGGRSSRGTQNFGDYFSRYIRDDDDDIVENGWQILMREADYAAEWKDDILELLCKLTVKCMAASPKRRYSTSDLIEELSKISSMNFASIPEIGSENDFTQVEELSTSDVHCVLCNRLTCKTVKCTDGHHTCVQCAEQEIRMQVGRSGEGIACKCGIVFHDDALYGKITSSIYHFYVQERVTQKVFDQNFSDMHKKLDTIATMTESNHDSIMTRLKSIDSKIQRVLGGLAYMATNSVQECPTLIWLVPAERAAGNSAKTWKQWTKDLGQRRYDLYFICQHSFEVVDRKLGITVTRSWLVQAAPVLALSLFFLRIALTIGGLPPLPFPIQKIARATQIAMNEDYVEDLLDDACTGSIEAFKTAYTDGTDLSYSDSSKLLTSMSASYEGVVKKATSLRKCVWKQTMEPVVNHLGCIIWVKKEYRGLYIEN